MHISGFGLIFVLVLKKNNYLVCNKMIPSVPFLCYRYLYLDIFWPKSVVNLRQFGKKLLRICESLLDPVLISPIYPKSGSLGGTDYVLFTTVKPRCFNNTVLCWTAELSPGL